MSSFDIIHDVFCYSGVHYGSHPRSPLSHNPTDAMGLSTSMWAWFLAQAASPIQIVTRGYEWYSLSL